MDSGLLYFILGILTFAGALKITQAAKKMDACDNLSPLFEDPDVCSPPEKREPKYVAKCKASCGVVTVNCYEDPWAVMKCHCQQCQEEYGAGPCTWAAFSASSVEILVSQGVTNHRGRRHVCAECEALMYMIYERDNQPYINVKRMQGDPFSDEHLEEIMRDPNNKIEVAHIYTGHSNNDQQQLLSERYRQRYLVPNMPEYSTDIQYAHGSGWYGFSGHYEMKQRQEARNPFLGTVANTFASFTSKESKI